MEQRKNAYVEHQHRIYSAAYVGRKVASEAVEYYYFRQHQVTNVTNLKKTLTKDMFNLGVKPYEFIRVLHIYLNIDKVVTRSKVDWKGWLVEEEDPEKAIAREKRHLNDLYQKLTSGLSLIVRGRRRWPVKIMIELTMGSYPGGGADARTQDQVTARRDYERGFLNVLETIRRPVYDTIHAGFEVEVAWNGNKAFTETALSEEHFFRLSKEEWEKEKASQVTRHGNYNPKAHYKPKSLLRYTRDINKYYQMDFAKNLPQYRARWGYESFERLLHLGRWNVRWKRYDDSSDSGGYPMPVHTNSSAYSDSERPDGWYDRYEDEYISGEEDEDDDEEDGGDVYDHSDNEASYDSLDEWALAQIA
ncbi:hypothetical protein J4E90_005920 [Alternaria incomplexa]|uniref:uncharacterized protein n=1 Tax=Alternaria incomplexa TaxID=1187928 RepID=UPI002220D132|nr:uncharacterized protein J4E90_005920 [Alternaria incomplexa]KAI4912516.1 hypothetical protein J4E90_005920 [Alternaria incomplexa]